VIVSFWGWPRGLVGLVVRQWSGGRGVVLGVGLGFHHEWGGGFLSKCPCREGIPESEYGCGLEGTE